MVDAADSKSATCEGVGVQVPSPVFLSSLIYPQRYGTDIVFAGQPASRRGCTRGYRNVEMVRRVQQVDGECLRRRSASCGL